jgi:hypothetical protein
VLAAPHVLDAARRSWLQGLALLAACAALIALALGARDSSFSLQLAAGCDELSECSRLEAQAEQRLLECWLVCRREVMDLQRARQLRYRAEERGLVRDHYQKRDAAERAEALAAEQRELDDWRREHAARERASAREHERRMELERLRQEHAERAVARERARRLAYLGLLSPEARKDRLRRCHAKSVSCEQLIVDLVEATTDSAEQRALAQLHERLLGGLEPRPSPPRAKDNAAQAAPEPERARDEAPSEPAEPAAASSAPSS